ncbi:MAG: hypothetical protein A2W19_08710 [Spirochaetes bacterium RBG_16_49_21]|nr:MAG: hypothetical protein A2W19_08710 [Spirochaetes bacterium RBG_16_49_21]
MILMAITAVFIYTVQAAEETNDSGINNENLYSQEATKEEQAQEKKAETEKKEQLYKEIEKREEDKKGEVIKDEKADQKEIENVKDKLEKEIKKIERVKEELEKEIKKIESVKKEFEKEIKKKEKEIEPEKKEKIEKEKKATEQEKKEEKAVKPEKKEEKAVIPAKEEKKPEKKRLSVIDKTSREYIALIFGYGGYFPILDYGKSYKPAHQFSGTIGIYYLNFLGLSPEVHVRYADMGSKSQLLKFNSSISLAQMFPAIVYRYAIPLPRNTLTVYARIFDGAARVAYSSRNPYYPIFKENITEYINIFGFSAGTYYDVYKGLLLGVDAGYSIIFTAGKRLQAVSVMMTVGWRIL